MNDSPLPLFVHGAVSDTDLLATVLGRPLRPGTIHSARAPGFRVVHYRGDDRTALLRTPGAAAEGLLVIGLSPFERDLLDAYAGEVYRRELIATMLLDEPELHEADSYVATLALPTNAHDWSLSRWQAEHRARALVSEEAVAARLRQRLIAIRPN